MHFTSVLVPPLSTPVHTHSRPFWNPVEVGSGPTGLLVPSLLGVPDGRSDRMWRNKVLWPFLLHRVVRGVSTGDNLRRTDTLLFLDTPRTRKREERRLVLVSFQRSWEPRTFSLSVLEVSGKGTRWFRKKGTEFSRSKPLTSTLLNKTHTFFLRWFGLRGTQDSSPPPQP